MRHSDSERLAQEAVREHLRLVTRRQFLRNAGLCIGAAAFVGLRGTQASAAEVRNVLAARTAPLRASAKRIIYIHLAGAPSQLELFDPKPELTKLHGELCPESFLVGKTFAFIKGRPKLLGPLYPFSKHGESGMELSDRLPNIAQQADDVCLIRSLWTEQFNHAPAQLLAHTGFQISGRPSMGSWVMYGLGSENENLPGFVVLLSGGTKPDGGKALWSSGFLPSVYQGVQCQTVGNPIPYLTNPAGVDGDLRRQALNALGEINQSQHQQFGDPETLTRISQYELAFRMQMSAPEATDLTKESPATLARYGAEPGKESFANNVLLARRMAERGVRFVQLYDWGWDMHGEAAHTDLAKAFTTKTNYMDKAVGALIADLRERGMLEDTLVVVGGEFGRTPMWENRGGTQNAFFGRDHHPAAFSMLVAGGGFRGGLTYGRTDEIGYEVVDGKMHVHDLQATLLHQLGLDHESLNYRYQGRDFRLTDTGGKVVRELIA